MDVPLGASRLETGMVVRVESPDSEVWSGRVTNVSDQLVSLRGYLSANGLFRLRDRVTVHVATGAGTVCVRAQVLAVEGTLLRVVRRDASMEHDRRRAPRLRVDLPASLTVADAPDDAPARLDADVVDLSTSGCAIRCDVAFRVGTPVRVCLPIETGALEVGGIVVRTWTPDDPPSPHCGVQFEVMAPAAERSLNRFLVDRLRSA